MKYLMLISISIPYYFKCERFFAFGRQSQEKKKRLDFPVHKFIRESHDFARENPKTTKKKIDTFLAEYATKYANSIKDVVVEDIPYQQYLYELIIDLWKVIIIESKVKKADGISIKPFELLWEEKDKMKNLFGDSTTEKFFIDELIDDMKDDSSYVNNGTVFDESETDMEFEHTSKKKLEDIKDEIPTIVHSGFEYDKYTKLDGSNERFLRKQKNTNMLNDDIFNKVEEITNDIKTEQQEELTLFD